MTLHAATRLETVFVDGLPETAVEIFEAAFAAVCGTVGFFHDEDADLWRVEGVKDAGDGEAALADALHLAAAATGFSPVLQRHETHSQGWLARTQEAFPEQLVGRRFAVRGTHLPDATTTGRLTIMLDAGLAFGSGEHGSTRGCLRALELVAHRRPRRILDLGAGSGILAMSAARLLHRQVLAVDIEPWSVRVAADNVRCNELQRLVACRLGDGWHDRWVRANAPYDLVFANILARPLCAMARDLALRLCPGGTAILAGLLVSQMPMVLTAHRRQGLRLERRLTEGMWATLILRKPAPLS
jgi:ribosomal protein L11 methyltransferase